MRMNEWMSDSEMEEAKYTPIYDRNGDKVYGTGEGNDNIILWNCRVCPICKESTLPKVGDCNHTREEKYEWIDSQ